MIIFVGQNHPGTMSQWRSWRRHWFGWSLATLYFNPEHPEYILQYFFLILFMKHTFACKYRVPFPPSSQYKESFYSDRFTLCMIALKCVFRKLWIKCYKCYKIAEKVLDNAATRFCMIPYLLFSVEMLYDKIIRFCSQRYFCLFVFVYFCFEFSNRRS